jgi:hypothetical protein
LGKIIRLLFALGVAGLAHAQTLGKFGSNGFLESETIQPDSYNWIDDPTALAPTSKLYSFTVSRDF